MCGVIFGEWRGDDPADRDMPKIRDKRKLNYFMKRGYETFERSTAPKNVYFCFNSSTCDGIDRRDFADLLDYTICELKMKKTKLSHVEIRAKQM